MVRLYKKNKQRRQRRVRVKIRGQADQPRLSVFRSHKAIYAQLINDQKGEVLAAASEKDIKTKKQLSKMEKAAAVGQVLAEKGLKLKLKKVKFDRGGYRFHGRVKALAQAARQAGLEF